MNTERPLPPIKLTQEQKKDQMSALWGVTKACYTGAEVPDPAFFEQCVLEGDVWAMIYYEFILGYALVNTIGGVPLLRSIAVIPNMRGKGIASGLLDEVHTGYRKAGLQRIRLHCKVDNAEAQRLYLAKGYRVSAYLKDYYAPEGDGLEMEKVL